MLIHIEFNLYTLSVKCYFRHVFNNILTHHIIYFKTNYNILFDAYVKNLHLKCTMIKVIDILISLKLTK
jgi:hypothetical protein